MGAYPPYPGDGRPRAQWPRALTLGGDLYEREVAYLVDQEWARAPDDVLWRRSKLGLHLPPDAHRKLADWFAESAGARKDSVAAV